MKLTNEFDSIRLWATQKGIYTFGDQKTQLLKLVEELGELSKAILKNDKLEFIDGLGDCVVVLTNLAELGNIHFSKSCESCNGSGGHYEDLAQDGGSKCWVDCEDCGYINIEHCTNEAYSVIAKRTGKMIGGTFVKDK